MFPADELVVMAIVNRTPDSFYDRGATFAAAAAVAAAEHALDAGAAIVDIGGAKRERAPPSPPAKRSTESARSSRRCVYAAPTP